MSNHTGSAPTWITCTYLGNMLQNALKNDKIRVHDFKIGPGSSVGDNYACQIFRITCDCTVDNKKESKSIIIKATPNTEMVDAITKELDFFKVEGTMFSETLPMLYEQLCAKISTERFFPRFYQIDNETKMFFVEDLRADGYTLADRKLALNLDHVLLVVKALAKLHASSYMHLKKNPDYKNKYLDHIYTRKEGSVMQKMIEGTSNYFLKSLHLWPISEDDKTIFRGIKFYDLFVESYERKESCFNALIHGDCWTNNMMFKYEDGKPISVKLFDFQISHYNSIGVDLNYFLFTSANESVKLESLEDVFKAYYDTFVSISGEMKGFTIDTVRNEFLDRLPIGFCITCTFRSGILADKPFDCDAYFEGRESESNRKMYENEKFIKEGVKLLPMFKKYGVFK